MAGGGGPAKADEPAPHPPKDQLPNVSYCITSPPPWRELCYISSVYCAFLCIFLCQLYSVFGRISFVDLVRFGITC